jgi:hypothetical protein
MASQNELDNWFLYHTPNSDQQKAYTDIRNKAKELAEMFNAYAHDCADKTAALRELRGTVMAMNLAIACYQPPTVESLQAILDANDDTPVTINPDGSVAVEEEKP